MKKSNYLMSYFENEDSSSYKQIKFENVEFMEIANIIATFANVYNKPCNHFEVKMINW